MVYVFQMSARSSQTDLLKAHRGPIQTLAYTDSGDQLISASDDTVVVWDAKVCV
jgi:WD40 repeat protein